MRNLSVDIRKLNKLKKFEFVYELENDSEFKLGKTIITDKILKRESINIGDETGEWTRVRYTLKDMYIKEDTLTHQYIDDKEVVTGLELTNNQITSNDFVKQDNFAEDVEVKIFNSANEEITNTNTPLATGYMIRLYKNGEMIKEYTIVIYGDTTGDGNINAIDALTLIKGVNNKVPFKSAIHEEAGRIMSKSGQTPNALDALAIVKSANNKYKIEQQKQISF